MATTETSTPPITVTVVGFNKENIIINACINILAEYRWLLQKGMLQIL